jgi:hypothetical protein
MELLGNINFRFALKPKPKPKPKPKRERERDWWFLAFFFMGYGPDDGRGGGVTGYEWIMVNIDLKLSIDVKCSFTSLYTTLSTMTQAKKKQIRHLFHLQCLIPTVYLQAT